MGAIIFLLVYSIVITFFYSYTFHKRDVYTSKMREMSNNLGYYESKVDRLEKDINAYQDKIVDQGMYIEKLHKSLQEKNKRINELEYADWSSYVSEEGAV